MQLEAAVYCNHFQFLMLSFITTKQAVTNHAAAEKVDVVFQVFVLTELLLGFELLRPFEISLGF